MIQINTDNISPYRGRRFGRAFYYAFKRFIEDPDNKNLIDDRAREIREMQESEEQVCDIQTQ